jgi:hypothetical protein
MKSFFKNITFLLLLAIGTFGCEKELEIETNEDIGFCSYLKIEEVSNAIPIINDFLADLPQGISKEETFVSLETWLNSFPCHVDAKIRTGIHLGTGQETMFGVSISVKDGEIMRDIDLDFASIDNAINYSQIAGFTYYKQDTVHVKTLYTDIEDVFELINTLDFDVKVIKSGIYLSSMTADENTLQYIISNLKTKPYTNDDWVSGYLAWYNSNYVIYIFARLYDMKNTNYQADWLTTMNEYELENYTNEPKHIIEFYIPEGTGEHWETIFSKYDFVDWAELSYTRYTIP